jgi:biotin-dependent carboxylase-like uncharacterized protein
MIEVLAAGIFSTIQDMGRFGSRHLGVPVSGVMDQYSAFVANSLLGNDKNSAVIEMTFNGPQLQFHKNARIAIVGSPVEIKLNNVTQNQNTVISINKADILSIGNMSHGTRCYLAIVGGFTSKKILNSRSYYPGITKQFQLQKGDLISFASQMQSEILHQGTVHLDKQHFNNTRVNVYPGPEIDYLTEAVKSKLFKSRFKVSSTSNRMAYKFEKPIKLEANDSISEIITSSVQPGTVQLTPSGEVIVLMRDCQTTGGYARIFQLTDQAINQLSQKITGSEILFNFILK